MSAKDDVLKLVPKARCDVTGFVHLSAKYRVSVHNSRISYGATEEEAWENARLKLFADELTK